MKTESILGALNQSSIPERDQLATLVRHGGVRNIMAARESIEKRLAAIQNVTPPPDVPHQIFLATASEHVHQAILLQSLSDELLSLIASY